MNQSKKTTHDSQNPIYRIGAVAKLSGVPVSTLRVWEIRYGAFAPSKSTGQHRLYTHADVLRACQLKQLSDAGLGISAVANLDDANLSRLLSHQTATSISSMQPASEAQKVAMVVVGRDMASRITTGRFTLQFETHLIHVTDVFEDLDDALLATLDDQPKILLIKVNALNDTTRAKIQILVGRHRILKTIVLYNYGQLVSVEALNVSGMLVRRSPLPDSELSDLINSVLLMNAPTTASVLGPTTLIPARKYSDVTLARIANISSDVLCECPRHVAELIGQLASFEQYSQECLSTSVKDADLHAYLRSVSGTARAMFERALEIVAGHEGISLIDAAPVVIAPFSN